jgi:uncharacterized membrane protein HdeD (DUF308 family)
MTDVPIANDTSAKRPVLRRVGLSIYGALLIVFGVAALLAPMLATLAASLSFGALLMASGIVGLAALAFDWRAPAFAWRLLWSIVAIIAGLCILLHPWPGALALTLILGASLIAQGALSIGHAMAHRRHKSCPWGQMAFGGLISILLGALLVWALPHAGMMVPGVFLALHLIFFGVSVMAVGLNKEATPP